MRYQGAELRHASTATACLLAVPVALLLWSGAASATEIRCAFGSDYTGSNTWNLFWFAENRTNLNDYTTTHGSGVDLTVAGWTHATHGYYCWPPPGVDWIQGMDVGQGGASRWSKGVSTATFGNLSGPWQVEVLSSMDPRVTTAFIQDITVNGLFADTDYRGLGENGDDFDAALDGQVQRNWLIWTSVIPQNGTVTVKFDCTEYGEGNIMNAVRLISVPEPATLALLALGGVAFLRRGKRAAAA